jgi:hypothetical protein
VFGFTPFAAAPFSSLAGNLFLVTVSESATASDVVSSLGSFIAEINESATGSDQITSGVVFIVSATESATGRGQSRQVFL